MYRRRWLIESSTREQRSSEDPNTTSHTMYELSIQVAQGRSNNESCLSLIHLTATTGFEHIFHCSEFPRSGWITLITHRDVLFGGPSLGEAAMWRRYPVTVPWERNMTPGATVISFLLWNSYRWCILASKPLHLPPSPPAAPGFKFSPLLASPHPTLSYPQDASNKQREGNRY